MSRGWLSEQNSIQAQTPEGEWGALLPTEKLCDALDGHAGQVEDACRPLNPHLGTSAYHRLALWPHMPHPCTRWRPRALVDPSSSQT